MIDRWQELEALVKPALVNLSDTAAQRGLLIVYTGQVIKLEHKVEQYKLKVEFYDNVAVVVGTQSVQDVAAL